jgi:hypothetical protein
MNIFVKFFNHTKIILQNHFKSLSKLINFIIYLISFKSIMHFEEFKFLIFIIISNLNRKRKKVQQKYLYTILYT